jgi:sigma-B regulation protein RsbU (phosphoserine phosphatase)
VFIVIADRTVAVQGIELPPVPSPVSASSPPQTASASPPFVSNRPTGLRLTDGDISPLMTLADVTIPPGAALATGRHRRALAAPADESRDENMVRWIQAAMDVLQSAAGSEDFFAKAAAALVDLVGLDVGQVLLYRNESWHLQAQKVGTRAYLGDERQASRRVLNHILAEKRTVWQVPIEGGPGGSLVGVNAVVAAPILDRKGDVIGVLYGDRIARGIATGQPPITKLEALLVELLAGGVAAGLARLEQEQAEQLHQKRLMLYERELQIGRNIQAGFLPETLPTAKGWEIVGHFQPAREVAGDFYDAFSISANHVALVIADVCDKGVGASLFMALTRSLIRFFCTQTPFMVLVGVADHAAMGGGIPAVLPTSRKRAALLTDLVGLLTVESANRYITCNHASSYMFVTLCICLLDTLTGDVTCVNAGHEPPTVIGPTGKIKTRIDSTGPAVGLLAEAVFDVAKFRLEPGDTLLLHTDGVTDARNAEGKSFSTERFLNLVEEGAASAHALMERLISELRTHIGTADQFDDITLLAIRRE